MLVHYESRGGHLSIIVFYPESVEVKNVQTYHLNYVSAQKVRQLDLLLLRRCIDDLAEKLGPYNY